MKINQDLDMRLFFCPSQTKFMLISFIQVLILEDILVIYCIQYLQLQDSAFHELSIRYIQYSSLKLLPYTTVH